MRWWQKPASDTQVTHGDRLWLYVLAAIIMMLLVIPTLIVIPMSFSDSQYLEFPPSNWSDRWYIVYLESSKWMRATVTSLQVGVLTMLLLRLWSCWPQQYNHRAGPGPYRARRSACDDCHHIGAAQL